MSLRRPYIPVWIRELVIDRQMHEANFTPTAVALTHRSTATRVRWKLEEFFAKQPVELHHRPALLNRERGPNGDYEPPANHPDYLVYLPADEHDVETRVRGPHGDYSDLAKARKRKRKDRKERMRHCFGAFANPPKRWPKRKFPTRRGKR